MVCGDTGCGTVRPASQRSCSHRGASGPLADVWPLAELRDSALCNPSLPNSHYAIPAQHSSTQSNPIQHPHWPRSHSFRVPHAL